MRGLEVQDTWNLLCCQAFNRRICTRNNSCDVDDDNDDGDQDDKAQDTGNLLGCQAFIRRTLYGEKFKILFCLQTLSYFLATTNPLFFIVVFVCLLPELCNFA